MAMVRGRPVFADISNGNVSKSARDDNADGTGNAAPGCGAGCGKSGKGSNRKRPQKVTTLRPAAPTALQLRAAAAPPGTSVGSSGSSASASAPLLVASAAGVPAQRRQAQQAQQAQIAQQQLVVKSDLSKWRDLAAKTMEKVCQSQPVAANVVGVTEYPENSGHSYNRATSSGRTRRSSSSNIPRAANMPSRLSSSSGTRRASPGSSGTAIAATCSNLGFEPESRRGGPPPATAYTTGQIQGQSQGQEDTLQLPASKTTGSASVSAGDALGSPRLAGAGANDFKSSLAPAAGAGKYGLLEQPAERTSLALLFEGMRNLPPSTPDVQVDSVLGDLVDNFLQASHIESQRHLPTTDVVVARLGSSQRESIIEWLIQAWNIMRLQDGLLYSTVLMLDRYCAATAEPLPMERMHKVLMAVICTVLKTCTVSDDISMPLRDLLLHLCRRQVCLEEILTMEHKVLQTLQYSGLSAPTPLDFLDAFCTPFLATGETTENSMLRCLANFLIQLLLFDSALYYRQPHAVLAAAATYVAFCGLQTMPSVTVDALFNDIAAVCLDLPDAATRVTVCAVEVHGVWLDFAASQGARVPCLMHKFSGSRLRSAVILGPPAMLPARG